MNTLRSLNRKNVAVLKGGMSAERSVSLKTGEMCAAALRRLGLDVTEIDVKSDVSQVLQSLRPDVCFNALHGRWGEDGCIQGLLEFLNIPYTHSGVLASAISMDKQKSKQLYSQVGLQTPQGRLLSISDMKHGNLMSVPYVIKPVNEGSSVGIYIVENPAAFDVTVLDEQHNWMIEEYIPGRELTVSILNDSVLGVTEIELQAQSQWYDFNAKYQTDGAKHICPAPLPDALLREIKSMALVAHHALGCYSVSRSDFRLHPERGLFILETNTQPGMTPTSLMPEQAAAQGMSFDDLCYEILDAARLHV